MSRLPMTRRPDAWTRRAHSVTLPPLVSRPESRVSTIVPPSATSKPQSSGTRTRSTRGARICSFARRTGPSSTDRAPKCMLPVATVPYPKDPHMQRFVLLSLLLAGLPSAAASQNPARQPIGTSTATLTPAIRVGNLVFGSGQLGLSRDNPDSTIQGQTKLTLENIKRVFEQAGTTMANVAKCTVFLIDVKDFGGMNEVYRTFFPSAPPARSTVVVAALVVPNAKVEIECVATMPQ